MAIAVEHLEPVLRATKKTLQDTLPGLIADINTAHASDDDPFTLDLPDNDKGYSIGGAPVTGTPFVEIAAPTFGLRDPTLSNFQATLDTQIILAWWVEDAADTERLYFRCLRYMAATIQALSAPAAFGGNAALSGDDPFAGYYAFNPSEQPDQEGTRAEWLAKAGLLVRLEAVEALTP
jgi:hypothetical protein